MSDRDFFQGRSVLVTGGAGLIGHELVAQLLARGAAVRATVFRERKLELRHPKLEIVPCDLMEADACVRVVKGMDVVLHAAAYIRGVQGQREDPGALVMRNLIPSAQIIDASCREGVDRFGWIGSSTVYPDADHPFREEEAFLSDPLERYFGIAWVKRYCEKLCMHFHRCTRTRFAIARSGAIYGPHERFSREDGHVLPALIMKAHERLDPFPVWGDGDDVRDFVYVSDFAEGLLLAVQRHAEADPVNIATGVGSRIRDVVGILLEEEGYAPQVLYEKNRPAVNRSRLLDVSKAKRLLGYEAKVPFREGLRRTMRWYKDTLAEDLRAC